MTRMILLLLLWAFSIAVFAASFKLPEAEQSPATWVIYHGTERLDYTTELLQLALSYIPHKHYKVRGSGAYLPKERAIDELGHGLDVLTGTCLKERAEKAMPVHFPIFKGANGLRIALVHKSQPDKLKGRFNIRDLQTLHGGQVHSWSDTKILRSNGLRIFDGSDYEGLYLMLDKQRLDYFPRSILEIENDLAQHSTLDLAIDSHLLLQYPSAFYFFVSKDNPELAQDLLKGLEAARVDGRFDALFKQYYGDLLTRFGLSQRVHIPLYNPLLCDGVPWDREELWLFQPGILKNLASEKQNAGSVN
ncbi:hypothetical protein P2G88_12280 [Aliiglaciecola sp. CAU 1673]|uniref:substrate-binding periplasmic protein n=1 Tax=Aliiglaciecola sp. CAU 1673 TaxID=3032595 RepID=UPI0023DA4CEC|nr:hypothetical protein [Aliiglaciecola sp. CAU 1673]MDF2179029.1 hypothetical protein [Aliiglaciecola sp. CAU 1673]